MNSKTDWLISKKWLPITIAGFIFAMVYMLIQDYIAVPWTDEIGTADTAINYVLFGRWDSFVWHYTYNPLHAFCLIGWLSVFGISHAAVCNLNVFLALLGFIYLEKNLISNNLLTNRISGFALVALYWLGFMIASIMTKGRIDILVMVLSIVLCSHLLKEKFSYADCVIIFISSLLLMLSSIYVIPLIVIATLLFWAIDFQNQGRKVWFRKGVLIAAGFILGFLVACIFYYKIDFLYHFLSTYFSFNGSIGGHSNLISRIITAYKHDIVGVLLCALAWSLVFINKTKDKKIVTLLVFVTLIPVLMTIAGRYAQYYVWMVELGASVLIVTLIDHSYSKRVIFYSLVIIAMISMLRPSYWIYKRPAEYRERMELYSFMDDNKNTLKKYGNVFFRDATCYYKVVEFGLQRYYLQNDNLSVNPFIVDFFDNKRLFEKYHEYYPEEFLPPEGVMITTPAWGAEKGCEELLSNHFSFLELTKNDRFGLFYFKKQL